MRVSLSVFCNNHANVGSRYSKFGFEKKNKTTTKKKKKKKKNCIWF